MKLLLVLTVSLVTANFCLSAQFQVFYYLPSGNDGRQIMIVEASDSGATRRIFQQLMPRARISECREIRHSGGQFH